MLPLQDTIRSRSVPLMNWTLIALNVFAFLFTLSLGRQAEALVTALGVVPARLLGHPNLWEGFTLFTSMFLHGGWAHLFSNMLALYIFGDNVEDRMGSGRYLIFYLLCGLVAAVVHILFNPTSTVPTIGASGAISGVLGAYLLLFPHSRVITLVPIFFLPWFVEIPAVFYLGVWFLSQLLNGTFAILAGVQAFGGVAWWAHVGGFVAGLVLVKPFTLRRYVRRYYVDEYWPW
ncbi:rhomboid family intramembrane serine protease [Litorilinea aerophila]|uniref:Rhomboid family intramembrane serine protease n=1 Tax=Litorilinea aerophila TaxID=1204385 RepID=A0A540V8M2_9CHLR|nr:rhomboid family intramembrane serine protease [Litorilinea aerophila]MCC9078988.1 rhomboid family intramembrane serine protease [Litorilinea aerophila]OUC08915.1 peptidase S54 [Litorilinea aerophila]GIV76724.1 MAG: rhomboid family intramembrane serine protease [Litorilinea sp.]GIV80544.1 MAG: rhomboid family intramembrane serine protease [Litorilinea sp.]